MLTHMSIHNVRFHGEIRKKKKKKKKKNINVFVQKKIQKQTKKPLFIAFRLNNSVELLIMIHFIRIYTGC